MHPSGALCEYAFSWLHCNKAEKWCEYKFDLNAIKTHDMYVSVYVSEIVLHVKIACRLLGCKRGQNFALY